MLRTLAIMILLTFGLILNPGDARSANVDSAAIINSGSTNRPGFRIVVARSGVAEYTATPPRRTPQPQESEPITLAISRTLTDRLYSDLKAASPLASLPIPHCVKSVSFGSRLTIGFGAEQSPDLSCGSGGNSAMESLIRDCNEIVALFQQK